MLMKISCCVRGEYPHLLDFIIEFYKRKIDVYEKYSTGADLRNLKYAKY